MSTPDVVGSPDVGDFQFAYIRYSNLLPGIVAILLCMIFVKRGELLSKVPKYRIAIAKFLRATTGEMLSVESHVLGSQHPACRQTVDRHRRLRADEGNNLCLNRKCLCVYNKAVLTSTLVDSQR